VFSFGWFSSGRDQAAIDLFTTALHAMESGFIPGKLAYVFCDRAPGETAASDRFIKVVRFRGVPLITHSYRALRQELKAQGLSAPKIREAFDAQVIELLQGFAAQVVVLAGYMLITSPLLCRTFLLLNLHPALPGGPQGTWQEVMWQLMEAGAQESGGMLHLATPELDAGPPVTYFRFSLRGPAFNPLWEQLARKLESQTLADFKAQEGETEPLFARIREEELRREFPLLLLTLKNLAEGTFSLTPAGVEVEGKLVPSGLDLTEEVEAFLKRRGGGGRGR
jgi:phosphoribosylglycinamide formyltransferase-1